jgi:hypothetical protein
MALEIVVLVHIFDILCNFVGFTSINIILIFNVFISGIVFCVEITVGSNLLFDKNLI